jgi:hypothetical protein
MLHGATGKPAIISVAARAFNPSLGLHLCISSSNTKRYLYQLILFIKQMQTWKRSNQYHSGPSIIRNKYVKSYAKYQESILSFQCIFILSDSQFLLVQLHAMISMG